MPYDNVMNGDRSMPGVFSILISPSLLVEYETALSAYDFASQANLAAAAAAGASGMYVRGGQDAWHVCAG